MSTRMREDQAAPARRGRKPKNKAVVDFDVVDAIDEYDAKRAALRTKKKGPFDAATLAPFEAAAEAMQETRKRLGHISAKRLLNLMSEFRHPKDAESIEIAPDPCDPPDHIPGPHK